MSYQEHCPNCGRLGIRSHPDALRCTNGHRWRRVIKSKPTGELHTCQLEFKCEAGCSRFMCGSIKHHKDCKNYPESLSALLDKKDVELRRLNNYISSQEYGGF